jgi:hypothetical protein
VVSGAGGDARQSWCLMVTVITKTIGPNPPLPAPPEYDYSNFTTAEAAVPTIVGGTDLVAADTAVVFEVEAGTYNESLAFDGGLTTDATRNVTYKAAAGSEHGGDKTAGVVLTSSSSTLTVLDAYTNVRGIVVSTTSTYAFIIKGDGAVASDCIAVGAAPSATSYGFYCSGGGTASAPIRIENCVAYSGTAGALYAYSIAADVNIVIVNTTGIVTGGSLDCFRFFEGGFQATVTLTNCLAINLGSGGACQTHTATFSGTNNFGPATAPFPVALRGTPATITASTAYDPGAGDFALYVGKNGALLDSPNNDVIGGGVGPSVNSDVPTTDILGNERSGALANPGAFEVPQATTVITRTIGPDGDFIDFTNAEANVATIGTSADLVFNNERIVFEVDAGTYTEAVIFSGGLTTDATRNVTYKPAAGSEHGGDSSAGVIIQGIYPIIVLNDNYTVFDGLTLAGSYGLWNSSGAGGTVCRNLICAATGSYGIVSIPSTSIPVAPITIENCVVISADYAALDLRPPEIAGTADYKVRNCTLAGAPRAIRVGNLGVAGSVTNIDAVNNLALVSGSAWVTAGSGTINASGSNNFGGSTDPFPVAIQGSPYPVTASTSYDPGAGDYALYVASNGALLDSPNNDVIGQGLSFLDGAGDVPGYDIIGNPRGAKISNPGAFEIPQGPTVVTKTIGSDKDYPDFTAAEAAVESIATLEFGSTDLVANNGAIVFEADAGLYSGSVTINSTLTTDATRQVTYRAAAGSEHNGDQSSGVIVQFDGNTMNVFDEFTVLEGLNFKSTSGSGYAVSLRADGSVARSCLLTTPWAGGFIYREGTSTYPCVFENCVMYGDTHAVLALEDRAGLETYGRIVNCTAIGHTSRALQLNSTNATGTLNIECHNFLVLGSRVQIATGAGTANLTGSGSNFGSSLDPWPVALQGTPYPVTATTDTDPGPGDWAIYDATNGALIDDPDNDVLGGGVGPDADADVPTTDIVGNIRSGDTTDPGAFQRPALDTIMRQIYQQDAPFAIGASPSGVSGITHQPGPAALDYFTINSTTSETITVPRRAHAMRIACVVATKACDVTLELDASNSVYLGTIGGIASVQADIDYFWSFASVASDGAYPRVKIEHDGVFSGDQLVYLWWHLA